ncbi:hypothetical protein [Caenibacillus caldisaponilyticus]|jgi:predicted metallo-beta-lactamase superfamily hydrolase|uniref:hypothetical protein n=1 Tax=Caenibacillus caldisaponilyticus TaxID=1674942 RepID=UPI00098872FC|nr:hypothetical protein [Caenibacillus caldisaponilyticus]
MAFGVQPKELKKWKERVEKGEVALLTHYWYDPRFPQYRTVTKAGCSNLKKLIRWGKKYGLKPQWIDKRNRYPHFDLMGKKQLDILRAEGCTDQIHRFRLEEIRE